MPSRAICFVLAAAVVLLLAVPGLPGCSIAILIWSLPSDEADPFFRIVQDGKVGYIDATGRIVIAATLPRNDFYFGEFHEGLLRGSEKGGYRFIDTTGATVFHTTSPYVSDFSEGLVPAADPLSSARSSRYGFLDRTGRFAIPPQFSQASGFSEGLAKVDVTAPLGSTGYIDRYGNFVVPPHFTYGYSFHQGRAAVIPNGPCMITNGASCSRAEFKPTVLKPDYDCRFQYIDPAGRPVSDARFDDAGDFAEGLAPVRIGKVWGYVDRSGSMVIPPRFEYAGPFSSGLAVVRSGGQAGYVDREGAFAIPPRFVSAAAFSGGRALVEETEGAGKYEYRFIDRTGAPAFPGSWRIAASFHHGLAPVELEAIEGKPRKLAWIGTDGKVVFAFTE